MAFKCEVCEEKQEHNERPILVVTGVRETPNGGYNTVEELKTCLLCAVKLTEVAPEVLKERHSTQSRKVHEALSRLGYRVQQFDPLVASPEDLVAKLTMRTAMVES